MSFFENILPLIKNQDQKKSLKVLESFLPRPQRTMESPSFKILNNNEDTNNAGLSIPGKIKHFWN